MSMDKSKRQRRSHTSRHPSTDGETQDTSDKEIELGTTCAPEGEPLWPEPSTADERFYPPLKLDVARYEAMLADSGMSKAERIALIEAMWLIVVSFVDLGFDLHPLQQLAMPSDKDANDPPD